MGYCSETQRSETWIESKVYNYLGGREKLDDDEEDDDDDNNDEVNKDDEYEIWVERYWSIGWIHRGSDKVKDGIERGTICCYIAKCTRSEWQK